MKNLISFVLSTIAIITLGSCSSGHKHPASTPQPLSSPRSKEWHLPTMCRPLLASKLESTWNPTTHSYTTNVEWEKCMGVEDKPHLREDM